MRPTTAEFLRLVDEAVYAVGEAVRGVYGRRLTARELGAARAAVAALLRRVLRMPPVRHPPRPPGEKPRQRRHARWFDPLATAREFKMPGELPPEE